ncbi:MAG: glycoside hydrolase family 2 protein [Actinomycetota bacterium]
MTPPTPIANWTALDLSGPWKVIRATDDLLRTGVGLGTDDTDWSTTTIPGHWQTDPEFARDHGPLLYRRRFDLPVDAAAGDTGRLFVVVDGLFYQGDIWLDGAYLGDPEGYFIPHAYDVTALARLDTSHVLSIGLTCAPQRDKRSKRNITGVFQDGDCIDPTFNPGGIWRDVRIERTGPVRIDALRVLCRDANEVSANLRISARLDGDRERSVRILTRRDGTVIDEQERSLARGLNEVNWDVDVDEPDLWWPWSLGEQNLCTITVEVHCDGEVSHSVDRRTGLREVAVQDWIFSVNGERLFLKGADLGPTRADLGSASTADLRRDVELARDAGLDLIRLHGHISRPELYDAADELGMLVWQDFPLQHRYARQVRRQAVRQARAAVSLLGHHPSILTWCAHNEPVPWSPAHETGRSSGDNWSFLARQQLPSWNKSILDLWVKRAFEQADDTRPCIAHSGVLPHLPQLDGTDNHLYLGWYRGSVDDLDELAARLPRLVRFVGEFGAQAVPESADFIDQEHWPDLDWQRLVAHHGFSREIFDLRIPPDQFATFEEWRLASQLYQSEVVKHHVERLRALKYRPTGGFCVFVLADSMPMISCSLLDHRRVPKAAYTTLAEACRPVIVVADPLPPVLQRGSSHDLDIHVISDLRQDLSDAVVTARVTTPAGFRDWKWQGDISADDCTRVGGIDVIVPMSAIHVSAGQASTGQASTDSNSVTVDLTLECGEVVATNRYRSRVAP